MKYFLSTILLLPIVTLAAPTDFKGLVDVFLGIIDLMVPLVFALTLIVFVWGVAKMLILNAGNEEEVRKGKSLMVIGIISLVIMTGIWGILQLLRSGIFNIQ